MTMLSRNTDRPRYWLLQEHTPVPCDDGVTWGRWFETADRTVAKTQLEPDVEVSTVFLGLDHNFTGEGSPLLFETMIFGLGGDEEPQWRYATWEEAALGHQAAVLYAAALMPTSACAPASLCEQCLDAPAICLRPAPWGGDMGVCRPCAAHEPPQPGAVVPPERTSMSIRITDRGQPAEEYAATLHDAMTLLLARYPEAVFSDIEWTEPTIWVWPSNAASQHADPAQAMAWLRQA